MRGRVSLLVMAAILFISCGKKPQSPAVTTIAGSGVLGFADGNGTSALFSNPMGVAADSAGNIYVADSRNNLIRKITPQGMVSTLAGSGKEAATDGHGTTASFFFPTAIATDAKGNVYVADTHNSLIRKITPEGIVSTIAGRSPTKKLNDKKDTARFDNPYGIAVDKDGNVFVADWDKNQIKKISPDGKVAVVAGNGERGAKDGKASDATFYLPEGITIDNKGNLYVADCYNNRIRKITQDGTVTTLAGHTKRGSVDGKGAAAAFWHPNGITVDKNGNVYVADAGNNKIRKITPDGQVSTFAGTGAGGAGNGHADKASFYAPSGIVTDKNGNMYIADYENNRIRKISL